MYKTRHEKNVHNIGVKDDFIVGGEKGGNFSKMSLFIYYTLKIVAQLIYIVFFQFWLSKADYAEFIQKFKNRGFVKKIYFIKLPSMNWYVKCL